jgi:hypothetical protein
LEEKYAKITVIAKGSEGVKRIDFSKNPLESYTSDLVMPNFMVLQISTLNRLLYYSVSSVYYCEQDFKEMPDNLYFFHIDTT